MQAIVYTRYGPPEVLRLKEVERPVLRDNEVLVRVCAASVNSWDWDLLRGTPLFIRMWGLFKPKYQIPGADIAGRVEAIGNAVTRFQPGDEVFGDLCESGWGGFAEYVSAPEDALAHKPVDMTFVDAAALPQAGVMALQGIRDYGQVQPGQKVLINGAGGGVGTFAVQMAKALGAEVTGVDRAEKFEMLRSIGADHLIDFTQEDFTKKGQRYDLILNVTGYHSIFDCRRSLSPGGIYIMVGGSAAQFFQTLLLGPLIGTPGKRKMRILAHQPNKDLSSLIELFQTGKTVPVIDRCYPLRETPEALKHLGEGRAKGKVVITIESSSRS